MKKEILFPVFGYVILGILMLLGSAFLWNSRATIDANIAAEKERARPADIKLTLITPANCPLCVDGRILVRSIESQEVRVLSSDTFPADSEQAVALIRAYDITKLPTIIVRGEYKKENIWVALEKFGGTENNDAFVMEIDRPAYFDMAENRIVGLVDLIYLTDTNCADCYDPKNHRSILENSFGVVIHAETSVDAASPAGRDLIKKYAIEEIPTVVLSSEASAYDTLKNAWGPVGSVEKDGAFVFRRNSVLGSVAYKNTTTGKIIRPENSNE